MLWTLIIVLLILWFLGFNFHLGGNLIHALLVVVLIIIILQLLT